MLVTPSQENAMLTRTPDGLITPRLQLRGLAGLNQVQDTAIAMIQNIGGSGSNVVTHILEREA